MLHNKFQASEEKDSEEEEFLIFFDVFVWFKHRIPRAGAILNP